MIAHILAHLENYPPLHTQRMRLIPLTLAQMQMQLDDYSGLERSLGARVTGNRLEKEMHKNVARGMDYMRQEPDYAIWNTFWAAILEEDSTFIGGIGFKGPANAEGEVELGYGFDAPYRNRGLATEAVQAMTQWAFEEPAVTAVTAETNYTNIASARVLQKSGFQLHRARNHFLYWRKNRAPVHPTEEKKSNPDGNFTLYDLAVVVEAIDGNCTCDMRVGDSFYLRNSSSLSLPPGGHFCVYALQAVLPLLPAKQRQNHPADWMETDSRAVCPDPACKLLMRVDRANERLLRHDDVSPIPWESV